MIDRLDVMLWGEKSGTLVASKEGYRTKILFYFDKDFVNRGLDIAPLRASIKSNAVTNGMPLFGESDKLFGGLPSFIADSLPDHWGGVLFREWAKSKQIKTRDLGALDRLAYIGRRGMGALEFLPSAAPDLETPFPVEVTELYRLSQYALAEASKMKVKLSPGLMIESLFKVGTSAGGKRPKAVINVNWEDGTCYSGQVATPAPGFTPMIIKFDERGDVPTTRLEYSYWLIAREVGMKMMPSRLWTDGDTAHFITERFDRNGDEKIHLQTLAAINPDADSYEDLFDAARAIGVPPLELRQLYLGMVMNVICGNVDDHSKNFSFLMNRDGQWHVAPAYDFTFSIDLSAPWYVNGHSLSVNGKKDGIVRADLIEIGKRYGIRGAGSMIDKAIAVAKDYPRFAIDAGVPQEWTDKITRTINDIINDFES